MKFSRILYCCMFLLTLLFTYFKAQDLFDESERKVTSLSKGYAERIQAVVHQVIGDAQKLEKIFKLYGDNITKKEFEDVAAIIFNDSYFLVISYQPDGIVKYVYPPEPYQWYVGMNLLERDDTKVDALYAKNSGRTVFSGPVKIVDYEGIIARRPVLTEVDNRQVFWGFVTIGFDSKKFLTNIIEVQTLTNFNYEYAIETVYQGKHIPVLKSTNFEKEKATKRVLTVGDQTWLFYLYDKNASKNFLITILFYFFIYFSMSTAIYVILRKYEIKSQNAKKMSYIDALTKAYNRKIVDEYMEHFENEIQKGFSLFYIDLNDFKPVNDIHGHEVGDRLLIAYVERVKHKFKQSTIVVRMGGDEFAIILNENLNEKAIASVTQRIEVLSKDVFTINGIAIHISASIGHAQYPADGDNITEILAKADEKMYAWKRRVKAERAQNAAKS